MPVDTSWIEKTAEVCGGEACIRDTRHAVYGLVTWKKLGLTDERILQHHPDLTSADLDAAWEYYRGHCDEIERAIRADEEA
jgi:uncharacterized protein (DUF433 family)